MRLSILPGFDRNLLVLGLAIALILVTNLAAQGGTKQLLLQFVPKEEQRAFFVPQEEPTVSSAAAVEAALSGGALWTDSASAVAEVVLVHLSDPNVDPPYDDRLAWVVNFNPHAPSEAAGIASQPEFQPLQFQYVLIDAHTGQFIFGAGGGGQPIGSW
jgi:hypothetical protein